MVTKAQINTALTALNLEFPTERVGGYNGRDRVIVRQRARSGGSLGPMTCTNGPELCCVKNQNSLIDVLKAELSKQEGVSFDVKLEPSHFGSSHGMQNAIFTIPLNAKLTRVLKFSWHLLQAYGGVSADNAYMNYWYILHVEDVKR